MLRLRLLFEGDTSERSQLFSECVVLLEDNPIVILIGGGMNYFQSYWSFTSGRFPHNVLLESLVAGGVGLASVYFYLYILPIISTIVRSWSIRLQFSQRMCLSLSILVLVVASKSGSILSSWGFGMFTCVFLSLSSQLVYPTDSQRAMKLNDM